MLASTQRVTGSLEGAAGPQNWNLNFPRPPPTGAEESQLAPGKHPVVDCEACSHLIGNLRLGPYTGCKNPRW